MFSSLDITGKTFGRLTAIKRVGTSRFGKAIWLFSCSCGKEHEAISGNVVNGTAKSCGCLKKEQLTTHGMNGSRVDGIFRHMFDRCYNPNNVCYKNYGGRGIAICPEWLANKSLFFEWSFANGYSDSLSIDRIDNDKGYSPDNCRWANEFEQANNTSRCVFVTVNGQTKTVAEWARVLNVHVNTLRGKIKNGKGFDVFGFEPVVTTR